MFSSFSKRKIEPSLFSLHQTHSGQPDDLDPDPAALNAVIKEKACQVSYTHIPHGDASSEEKDEEVLPFQFDIFDDQSQFNPGKKQDHAQDGLREKLKEERDRITEKEPGQENHQSQNHQRPARSGAKSDMTGHTSCPMA